MYAIAFSKSLITLISLLISFTSAPSGSKKLTGYNLDKPDLKLMLPDTLREVSGLVILDSSTFACIQDENGILFIYDIENNKIKNQYTFHINGDYEGITKVGHSIYILRSDGMLFELVNYLSGDTRMNSYNTGIPADNNEGLCYDNVHNRLYIACKGKIGKTHEYKDKRLIYSFDLNTKELSGEPIFDFDMQKIKEFVVKNKIAIQSKTRKKKGKEIIEPVIKFRTSAIGIHPKTRNLYLLSASDYLLFVFTPEGDPLHIEQLNPKILNKAEGISFFEDGDMLITNEGQDKHPTVLRYNYKPKK